MYAKQDATKNVYGVDSDHRLCALRLDADMLPRGFLKYKYLPRAPRAPPSGRGMLTGELWFSLSLSAPWPCGYLVTSPPKRCLVDARHPRSAFELRARNTASHGPLTWRPSICFRAKIHMPGRYRREHQSCPSSAWHRVVATIPPNGVDLQRARGRLSSSAKLGRHKHRGDILALLTARIKWRVQGEIGRPPSFTVSRPV